LEAPNNNAAPSAAGVRSSWPAARSSPKNHSEWAPIPRGAVQVGDEDESRQHVGDDDLRPRHRRDAARPAQQQPRVEDQLLRHEAERDGEQQARRRPQGGDRPGQRDAEQPEHREVYHGVGGHQSERRGRDVPPG